jgi:glucokinase
LFEHAEQGDTVALAVRERCLKIWAANAVSNINAYDPEVLIFGGSVIKSAHIIVPFVQEFVKEHAWSGWGHAEIRAAALGNAAGLLGAVPLLSEDLDAPPF